MSEPQGERINSVAISNVRSGELAVSTIWTTDPDCVPEGWQLCEPPAPDGWYRYERKRRDA